ncbi:MAG: hypothetical protein KDD84_02070 [Caldilineaceae bacterium]|nr:hypothetical protein [Caldilineaceae bacterium]
MEYEIIYAPQFRRHLRWIERKYYTSIQSTIAEQLPFEPTVETRNRKPLSATDFDADWEIRFGPDNRFRVFYAVDQHEAVVYVYAIGIKVGSRLLIDGQEVIL